MAVRSFYTDVNPNPEIGFLGTFLTNWVGQRASENAQEREARAAGEDPKKLADLEMEIQDTLGKLQEGKGKTIGEREVQEIKNNGILLQTLGSVYKTTIQEQGATERTKIGARKDLRTANAEAVKATRARMGYDSDERRHTLGTFASAMDQVKQASPGSKAAQAVIDTAAQAALTQEGAGASGERHDRVLHDLWTAAKEKGYTAEANYIAGKLMHVQGDNVDEYMAKQYGNFTEEQQRAEAAEVTKGGAPGFPYKRKFDQLVNEWGEPVGTVNEHSERGPDEEGDAGGGEAPVRRKVGMKGDFGSLSLEADLSAAAKGDKGAADRIAAAFDAAIAEQRAAAEDIRKRREAALSQSGPSRLPTGNVLIDNPNTYTETYVPKAYGRAAMAPREQVFRPVEEPEGYRGGFNKRSYDRGREAPGVSPEPGTEVERKREDLRRLSPSKVDTINAMPPDKVIAVWGLDRTQAALVKALPATEVAGG